MLFFFLNEFPIDDETLTKRKKEREKERQKESDPAQR